MGDIIGIHICLLHRNARDNKDKICEKSYKICEKKEKQKILLCREDFFVNHSIDLCNIFESSSCAVSSFLRSSIDLIISLFFTSIHSWSLSPCRFVGDLGLGSISFIKIRVLC